MGWSPEFMPEPLLVLVLPGCSGLGSVQCWVGVAGDDAGGTGRFWASQLTRVMLSTLRSSLPWTGRRSHLCQALPFTLTSGLPLSSLNCELLHTFPPYLAGSPRDSQRFIHSANIY